MDYLLLVSLFVVAFLYSSIGMVAAAVTWLCLHFRNRPALYEVYCFNFEFVCFRYRFLQLL